MGVIRFVYYLPVFVQEKFRSLGFSELPDKLILSESHRYREEYIGEVLRVNHIEAKTMGRVDFPSSQGNVLVMLGREMR